MRIINTAKKNILPAIILSAVVFLVMILSLRTCAKRNNMECADEYARQAEERYRQAIGEYRKLIARGGDADTLYLRLGELYYKHGDFKTAIDALRQSSQPRAKKFLAISYYRTGDFTAALDVFQRNSGTDPESLYYYALTCEKLNLFEQALQAYKKINKGSGFAALAQQRIEEIEKQQAAPQEARDTLSRSGLFSAGAAAQQDYPQAGALVLSCDEKIEVDENDRQAFSLHYVIKILNQRGKEDFSEAEIDYDSTYEKVELEYARTIKPDGTVVEVGKRHIRDVSKYLNFPLYSNARLYIISFPEVVEGAVIEYKVKVLRSQMINKDDLVAAYPVQASEPVLSADFSIELPQRKKLNSMAVNGQYNDFSAALAPRIENKPGRIVYSWQFKNIPQIIPESNMPPAVEINPALLLSTFGDWQQVYDWWWAMARDKIKADKAIKQEVARLIQGKNSPEDKARAIYNFCAQKIRYVAVEYGQAGYEPHEAELIFRNKYGDCKDQAILLVTMLREAGLQAWPVLIATRDYYNLEPAFASALFNHCIAAVALDGKTVFLDATAETCSFGDLPAGDQQRKVLLFKDDGYAIEEIPLYPAEHNLLKQLLEIKIGSDEGITAGKAVLTYGLYDQAQRHWLLYTQPELIREALKERIQEISIGAKLLDYSIDNLYNLDIPVVLRYDFRGPEYFTDAGALRIMPQLAELDTALAAREKRRYPLDFGALDSREDAFTIEIPDNFAIKYIPESISQDSPWLKFEFSYSRIGNKILFSQKSRIKKRLIPQEEYQEFKSFFEGLAKKIKQRIVLERRQ